MRHQQQSGFSLIELIMVIIIVALASVPILGRFTQVATSTLLNEDIQTASQLAQERAEGILALRRGQGYMAVPSGTSVDDLTGKLARFSRSVTIAETSSSVSCPTGARCKSVLVNVSLGLKTRSEIAYLLVDY